MFTQLCKQAWFVCLMVFAIGWSGVSVASVKTMQISMQMQHQEIQLNQTQNLQNTSHAMLMQNMSVQDMKQHCADLEAQNNDTAQSLTDCHNQLIQSQHVQHADCQNCALFSCQSSIVWFNTDIPKLSAPQDHLEQNSLQIHYQAQHLAGHWQEILRPPKA